MGLKKSDILSRVDRESLFVKVILEQRLEGDEEVGPVAPWGIGRRTLTGVSSTHLMERQLGGCGCGQVSRGRVVGKSHQCSQDLGFCSY